MYSKVDKVTGDQGYSVSNTVSRFKSHRGERYFASHRHIMCVLKCSANGTVCE